jgi:SAM-dependent methyltransferase
MATWHLLTDDADERRRFADQAMALAADGTPAGPRNRLRSVRRIDGDGATWFLKVFSCTQWKNRVRFRCTAPRASSDAEREYRVTAALRAAGHLAPVPVAWGTDGPGSAYLCRAVPGTALAELLAQGGATAAMARAVAEHCGAVLREGFLLPDLSADHVFVHTTTAGFRCALIDLHNGALGRPGPAPRWLLRRVLRRFARSVRLLPVSWPQALRFAVRLVRAAGQPRAVRRLFGSLPPFSTAARYEADGKSEAYASRNPARDAREQGLLRRIWPGRRGETVLDLPCGTGRLLPLLRDHFGHRVVHADGALAMLRQARAATADPAPSVAADALAMPFADRAFDGVVVFRFLHHLPGPLRAQAIAEACRVADRFVVVSFFHPCSFHHLQRTLGRWFGGQATRFPAALSTLRREFGAHGFQLLQTAAELPFARDLWLAGFARR